MGQKAAASAEHSSTVACASDDLGDLLRKQLSTIPEVEAVFTSTDENGVTHVFSVVAEYDSAIYDKLLKKERIVEKKANGFSLEFHVRAHQGRQPERAVPFDAQQVFAK